LILSKTKTPEERCFYLDLAIKAQYSARELSRQLNAAVYEKSMLATSVSPARLAFQQKKNAFKDSYVFEFLGLQEDFNERELQKSLIKNLKLFITENVLFRRRVRGSQLPRSRKNESPGKRLVVKVLIHASMPTRIAGKSRNGSLKF